MLMRCGAACRLAVLTLAAGVCLILPSGKATATTTYEFIADVTSGTLVLGGNVIDLAGARLVASGSVLDETDMNPLRDDMGYFAATTIYDFGALGSFETDAGEDFYFQFQSGFSSQFGLVEFELSGSNPVGMRFQDVTGQAPLDDPNVLQALGALRYDEGGPFGQPRVLENDAGDTLVLADLEYTEAGPNIVTVPEPSTASLSALGLLWLAAARRRRRIRA